MTNKELVYAYYDMWNKKEFDKVEQLCHKDIHFRGSLDITVDGIDGFKEYTELLINAFPNMYHAVEMIVAENNTVACYVTYTGTHEGKLFDYAPTHKRITYAGASFFQIQNGKIVSINVLGDLNSLHKQLQ